MPTLGEFIGAMMADLTHARRIADEEAVRIAEYYRQEPLLRGMPVPRIRLPEVIVEVPVIIDEHVYAAPQELAERDQIVDAMWKTAAQMAQAEELELPGGFESPFRHALEARLDPILAAVTGFEGVSARTQAAEAAQSAFKFTASSCKVQVPAPVMSRLADAFQTTANSIVVRTPASAMSISLKVETATIKTETHPKNVTSIRIEMREEGLEWHQIENQDGSKELGLTPE